MRPSATVLIKHYPLSVSILNTFRSSTESEDEAGKERGTSVEMGEDPLSWQSEGFPGQD